MGKGDFHEVSESGNWNVAQIYTEKKIMSHHLAIDEYQTLAKFGTSNYYQELANQIHIKRARGEIQIDAFRWFIHHLLMLIENSLFALDRNEISKKKLGEDRIKLQKIESEIKNLTTYTRDEIKKIKICNVQPAFFEKLAEVIEIKLSINEALNKADLIFTYKEKFDPQKYKQEIFEAATSQG